MNTHKNEYSVRPSHALAFLVICASLLLAAVGFSTMGLDPSGTYTPVIRDPENPAYAGRTIGSLETTGVQIVRDPENPYWTGASISAGSNAPTQFLR